MNDFAIFSSYWATPISNFLTIIVAIIILYPLVWKLTMKQLSAAIKAIETAKALPGTIDQLTEASESLAKVNIALTDLKEGLPNLDEINEQLAAMARQMADLRKVADDQPPALPPDEPDQQRREDAERWAEVSALWQQVKEFIEGRISSIDDGRVRRKYTSITRYTFDQIAAYLRSDGLLDQVQVDALNEIDLLFRSVRNRRIPVTPLVKDKFVELSRLLMR